MPTLTGRFRRKVGKEHVVRLCSDLPHSVDALVDSLFPLTVAWHEPALT